MMHLYHGGTMDGPLDRLERAYGDRLATLHGQPERSLKVIFWSAVSGPLLLTIVHLWWTGFDPNWYLLLVVAIPFVVVARVAAKRLNERRSVGRTMDVDG
jgi:asparagine N-glycosylation enzyme membrane subunit Stt3